MFHLVNRTMTKDEFRYCVLSQGPEQQLLWQMTKKDNALVKNVAAFKVKLTGTTVKHYPRNDNESIRICVSEPALSLQSYNDLHFLRSFYCATTSTERCSDKLERALIQMDIWNRLLLQQQWVVPASQTIFHGSIQERDG